MSNFKNGDQVRLKSWSPRMTVVGSRVPAGSSVPLIECVYFDPPTDRRAGSLQTLSVIEAALEVYKDPS